MFCSATSVALFPIEYRFLLEALPRRVQMHLPAAASHLLAESADPNTNAPIIAINRVRKGVLKKMLAQVGARVKV